MIFRKTGIHFSGSCSGLGALALADPAATSDHNGKSGYFCTRGWTAEINDAGDFPVEAECQSPNPERSANVSFGCA
jgi:hypothetical protein